MATLTSVVRLPQGRSVHPSILRAVAWVAAAGVVVKLAATAKEIAVAGVYGRSDAMDAFLAAALVPALLVNLISESMNQALVPTLVRVRELEGREPARQLLSNSMVCLSLLLGAVSVLMAISSRGLFPLIASHFPAAKQALAIQLFLGLLPMILVAGIASNCTTVLNTLDRFALPALAPVLIPLTIVAGVLTLGARLGIWAMVYSTLAGSLAHALLVVFLMNAHGYRLRLRWYGMTEATREVARQYAPLLLSSVVASGGLLVDQSMAAMLPAGSVAALAYGNRFVSVVLALFAGAVSTVLTPHFSRLIAVGDWPGCRQTVRHWIRLTTLVSVPVAVLLIAASRGLVSLAFQHGAFGPRDTAVVASVMAMYAVQIPFFVASRVFYRFIVAVRRTGLILYCGTINLLLDVVLNIVLMRWLGVAGIALATSLWTVSTFLFLWYWTWKLLPHPAAPSSAPNDPAETTSQSR